MRPISSSGSSWPGARSTATRTGPLLPESAKSASHRGSREFFNSTLSRGMTLGVRGIAQDTTGAVMLVRHSYAPGWHLPGGGVERHETADAAMRKEFSEEAGLAPDGPMQLIAVYLNPLFRGDHVLLYRCHAWHPCATDSAGEIVDRAFFPLNALPPTITPATLARLHEVFHGHQPSLIW